MSSTRTPLGLVFRLGITVAIALIAERARAQATLHYEAPGDCPSQAQFVAEVSERDGRLDLADPSLELRAAIARAGKGYSGTLRLHAAGAVPAAPREVHGVRCDEVVDALAVVTAIALRDAAAEPAATAPETASAQPPPARDATPAPQTPPSSTQAAPAQKPAPKATTVPPHLKGSGDALPTFAGHKELPVPAGTLRFDRTWALTLAAGAELGLLPDQLVPRFEFTTLQANFVTPPQGASMLLYPILHGRVSVLGPGRFETRETSTTLVGLQSAIGTCLTPHFDTRGLAALFCTELGFGVVQLDTEDRAGREVQSKLLGYGSVSLSFEGRYNLSSLLHLGLELGMSMRTQPFSAEAPDGSRIFRGTTILDSESSPGYGFSGHALLGFGLHL